MFVSQTFRRIDRVRQRSITDFAHHHRDYIAGWRRLEQNCVRIFAMHRESEFRNYLAWYHGATRYRLRQAWTQDDYADIDSSDDDNTAYDIRTREGSQVELGPVLDRVVSATQVTMCMLTTEIVFQTMLYS